MTFLQGHILLATPLVSKCMYLPMIMFINVRVNVCGYFNYNLRSFLLPQDFILKGQQCEMFFVSFYPSRNDELCFKIFSFSKFGKLLGECSEMIKPRSTSLNFPTKNTKIIEVKMCNPR